MMYLAPALLVLGALLAAGNWYLQPARAATWIAALALFFALAVVWAGASIVLRRAKYQATRQHAGDAIRNGVAFAGLIMVFSLGAKLAVALGVVADPHLSRRLSNVIAAAVLVFIGNALPKMLTPLSVLQCDGARAQAFQRFTGWTWVLTGLALATVWLTLPLDLARSVSLVLIGGAMLVIIGQMVQMVRLRRTHQRDA